MTKTTLDLFRSPRIEQFPDGAIIDGEPAPGVLYPDFEARPLPYGKSRKPDVDTFLDEHGNQWVKAGKGTSLWDRDKVMSGKGWLSFKIPEGTLIPPSLLFRHTDYNEYYGANHYQIESAAKIIRSDAMRGALDNLARNAIVRAVELGHGAKVKI